MIKRETLTPWLVLVALVALGAGVRVALAELPNFAPVAAIALFAGYYFRHVALAVAAPLLVMVASDWFIGGYDAVEMAIVYGALTAPVGLRPLVRRWFALGGSVGRAAAALGGLLACSLGSSVGFFLASNLACWWRGALYDHTLAGLIACFTQALPFFRFTLTGDLLFAVLLFGGYAAVLACRPADAADAPTTLANSD